MQMMQQQGGMNNMGIPTGPSGAPTGPGMGVNRPAYNAQEQLAFEQRKYEQQQARRAQIEQGGGFPNNNFAQQQGPQSGSATSWEGMYDDVPPPHNPNAGGRGSAGVVRNLTPSNAGPGKVPKGPATPQPSAAPANAPTGPKNAGVPGANFRNRGGRGGGGRFHPYGR
jgi:RNA-binding protein Musashi